MTITGAGLLIGLFLPALVVMALIWLFFVLVDVVVIMRNFFNE